MWLIRVVLLVVRWWTTALLTFVSLFVSVWSSLGHGAFDLSTLSQHSKSIPCYSWTSVRPYHRPRVVLYCAL